MTDEIIVNTSPTEWIKRDKDGNFLYSFVPFGGIFWIDPGWEGKSSHVYLEAREAQYKAEKEITKDWPEGWDMV